MSGGKNSLINAKCARANYFFIVIPKAFFYPLPPKFLFFFLKFAPESINNKNWKKRRRRDTRSGRRKGNGKWFHTCMETLLVSQSTNKFIVLDAQRLPVIFC